LAAREVLTKSPEQSDDRAWFVHPFCLLILRRALDDTTPTGATLKIEGNILKRLVNGGGGGSSFGGVPPALENPAARVNEAVERKCDAAAEKIPKLVLGFPDYHALFKDADARLKALRETIDRFQGRFRRASDQEMKALGHFSWAPTFLVDMKPLDRAATAEDVKAGRAVFHLDGKGKPAELKLPAVAVLRRDEKALVLQAEVGPDGETIYGVLSREGLRAVPSKEVIKVTALTPPREPWALHPERRGGGLVPPGAVQNNPLPAAGDKNRLCKNPPSRKKMWWGDTPPRPEEAARATAAGVHACWRACRLRSDSFRKIFRSRTDFGVISTSSSSSMYSSASSNVICRGAFKTTVFSAPAARMLVSFFSRQAFTGRSLSRQCSATICPS
jgi:hypothetical protein